MFKLLFAGKIICPGSYPCEEMIGVNVSKCINMEEVCDGDYDCPSGDDETHCSKYSKSKSVDETTILIAHDLKTNLGEVSPSWEKKKPARILIYFEWIPSPYYSIMNYQSWYIEANPS